MRSVPSVVVLSAVLAAPIVGQARVRTEVDATRLTVGDRITLEVTVEHEAGASVTWPDSPHLDPFEVLELRRLPAEATPIGARSTARLTLTVFELGELEIPTFEVEVVRADGVTTESLTTDRFGVEVVSVGVDESGDIRDIRGPLMIPLGALRALLWILLPLLVAGLMYGFARRLRSRGGDDARRTAGPPPRPPHETALEALATLESSGLLERGQVKEYHIIVSDILRTYVEDRFRVDALEMTTLEVLEGLERTRADASFIQGLRAFLQPCDLVKFAKARPSPEESRQVLALGRQLVEQSAARVAPAEAA